MCSDPLHEARILHSEAAMIIWVNPEEHKQPFLLKCQAAQCKISVVIQSQLNTRLFCLQCQWLASSKEVIIHSSCKLFDWILFILSGKYIYISMETNIYVCVYVFVDMMFFLAALLLHQTVCMVVVDSERRASVCVYWKSLSSCCMCGL